MTILQILTQILLLTRVSSEPPNIVDVQWRLDYYLKVIILHYIDISNFILIEQSLGKCQPTRIPCQLHHSGKKLAETIF